MRPIVVVLCSVVLCAAILALFQINMGVPPIDQAAAFAASRERSFPLTEDTVFAHSAPRFLRGQSCPCELTPSNEIKAYPRLVSQKPWYGRAQFAHLKEDDESGVVYHFVLDESHGTGQGYDRLYLDLNQDLDLSNDPPLAPGRNLPPAADLVVGKYKQVVAFDYVTLTFALPDVNPLNLPLLPRLTIHEYQGKDYAALAFVSTQVHCGKITLGPRTFEAMLGFDYYIGGRFDHPATALRLSGLSGLDEDRLITMHRVGMDFYQISASPDGRELKVKCYDGDFGVLEVGAGGRPISQMSIGGTLRSVGSSLKLTATDSDSNELSTRAKCLVPVGDYLPRQVSVRLDQLQLSFSENYHSEGRLRDRGGRPSVYGIKIRKEQPFVLDFTNPPQVMFAAPVKNQGFHPGDTVLVKAILTDPILDIMIRRLSRLDAREKKTYMSMQGPQAREVPLSLDPKVVISRADGTKVAEGVMPFG